MKLARVKIETTYFPPIWAFEAYVDGVRAGRLECHQKGDNELWIKQFRVLSEITSEPNSSVLQRIFGSTGKLKNFRGKGIGRSLIECMLTKAHDEGIQLVRGDILRRHLDASPFLMDWFERMNFSINEPEVHISADVKKTIELHLSESPVSEEHVNCSLIKRSHPSSL